MALRLIDSTAIIKRLTNLIQGNSDWFMGIWAQASHIPISPEYITIISKQNLDTILYNQWAGIYSDFTLSNGSYQVNVNAGTVTPPQFNTPSYVTGTTLVYYTYRKIGNDHLFYINGILIGSITLDLSAVIFASMLLGNDRLSSFGAPLELFDFIEYNNAKSESTITNQMAVIGSPVDPINLVTFTPLQFDLNDISGNGNHWSGSGNFDFTVNPPTEGEFTFSAGNLTPSAFGLDDDESIQFSDIPIGSGYSIIENVPPGWQVTYQVSNGSHHTNISVAAGETVTVLVTNTRLANASSGIYKIVPGKRNDTLWLENFVGTRDVKIPGPKYKTGLFGE